MTQDLMVAPPTTALTNVTHEQYAVIRKTIAKDATPEELELFLYDCQRQGVHPLDRLLHFTKRSGKYVPITSIDLMRARAADTGEHAGTDDPVYHGTPSTDDFTAAVTVYRMVSGQRCGFTASARWHEYKPAPGSDVMWKKMPHLMLGKCAEALALRKAFPRQLAGTYTNEEMAQADAPAPPRQHVNTMTGEIVEPSPRQAKIAALRDMAEKAKVLGLDPGLTGTPKSMTDQQLDEALTTVAAMIESELTQIDQAL